MGDRGNVDNEAAIRAKVTLLRMFRRSEERGISLDEEIHAYRVLVKVGPLTYLPKLAGALLEYGSQMPPGREEVRLRVYAEAADAVRRLDENEPKRSELLIKALDAYQRQLDTLGRRAEGLAVREEMAAIGRRRAG